MAMSSPRRPRSARSGSASKSRVCRPSLNSACPVTRAPCSGAQPHVQAAFEQAGADVPHVKVEDGPGRRLGRSFGVKLWPTLVFLRDGVEVEKLVRPQGADDIVAALQRIA